MQGNKPKIVAVVQARMGSRRLPGKVFLPVKGKPMLAWILSRISGSQWIDNLILATTTKKEDDILASFASEMGVSCFRGSETDVLDRFYQAVLPIKPDAVVRLTADNPIVDAAFVDWVIGEYGRSNLDYVAAVPGAEYHLPMGLAAEVFSFPVLEKIWTCDIHPDWREHVTQYIRRHPDLFSIKYLKAEKDYSHLRVTVDTLQDYLFVTEVFKAFQTEKFSWMEALEWCMCHCVRGYIKSPVSQKNNV
ncbi:glycosyltransferase family protein [candidate division KSB1 bacterium]|nr:glycosyltransferase family protein [candidate division KSB1 bacterium]